MLIEAKKFHDEVWHTFLKTPEAKDKFRRQKRMMRTKAEEISALLTPQFRKKYHFGGPMPIGMGLNAFVYPSSIKGVMIKLTFSKKEAETAERIKETEPDFISVVHEVIFDAITYNKDRKGHLIYMEQLHKPSRKVNRALEDLLHPSYFKNNGTPRPKELIQNVIEQVEKAPKGSVIHSVARQLVKIFKGLYATKAWHADLHADNIMVNEAGQLRLIDIGGLKELNVPTTKAASWSGPLPLQKRISKLIKDKQRTASARA